MVGSLAALVGTACGDDTTSTGGSSAGGAGTGGSASGGSSSGGAASGGAGTGGAATGGAGTGGAATGGGATGGAGGAPPAECTESIALNHGHVLDVPLADVMAGTDKIYDIMGSSMHTHTVTIGASDFALLAQGMTVMLVSSTGAMHTHTVTVTCPAL